MPSVTKADENTIIENNPILNIAIDIEFNVSLFKDSDNPGTTIQLSASLKQFDSPIENATVTAHVTRPDGAKATFPFQKTHPGHFKVSYNDTNYPEHPGNYIFRVRAKGITKTNVPFSLEKTLAGYISSGDYT